MQNERNPHAEERQFDDRPDHSVYLARRAFHDRSRDGKSPTHLFLSIGFHNVLLAHFNGRLTEKKVLKSLQGCKAYGMTVHIVPTLEDEEFYVA